MADLEQTGVYESGFRAKNLIFSVERVEFEMAVLKQRKIDGERRVFQDKWTDKYFFIAHKMNSCGFSFFRKHHQYSFRRGSSREGYEVSKITLTPNQSPNATANQLDIFQFAANPN